LSILFGLPTFGILQITSRNNCDIGWGPLGATNASKHSIDQSEDRILRINQSKNRSICSAK